jgi:hypothetical protein
MTAFGRFYESLSRWSRLETMRIERRRKETDMAWLKIAVAVLRIIICRC